MYCIVYSEQARVDIFCIKVYIKHKINNPNYASKLSDNLKQRIRSLKFSPERFVEIDINGCQYRRMPVEKYNVYYSVDKENETVTIQRILYGGLDINQVAL